ncbi:MAG TPA: hypothetical protein VFK41_11175 [Nocardioidaceae bacterium]|nr:hypothetical protein [Nocardioidaceae bacterium]
MSATTLVTILLPLAASDEQLEKVRPGWIPLIIVVLIGAFIAFLFFSMRKQLGKIDIPEGGVATRPSKDEPAEGEEPSA